MKRVAFITENITWDYDCRMAEALGFVCKEQDLRCFVYEVRFFDFSTLIKLFKNDHIDGAVFLTDSILLTASYEDLEDFMDATALPCVSIGQSFPNRPTVQSDNVLGMEMMVEHLHQQGVKTVAHIGGPTGSSESQDRKKSFLQASKKHGLITRSEWVIGNSFAAVSGYHTTKTLLPWIRSGALDAIMYCNDETAMGGFRLLVSEGISIPEDVLITGFGGNRASLLLPVPLTTACNDTLLMASRALQKLNQLDQSSPLTTELCPPVLLANASTKAFSKTTQLHEELKRKPMTGLYHSPYFSYTSSEDTFWEDIKETIKLYEVQSFHVLQYQTDSETGEFLPEVDGKPNATLLFSYVQEGLAEEGFEEKTNPFGLSKDTPAEPCLIRQFRFGTTLRGILYASIGCVAIEYLDALMTYCVAWLETHQQLKTDALYKKKLSDTMTQLMATNQRINDLNIQNSLTTKDASPLYGMRQNSKGIQMSFVIFIVDIDGLKDINIHFGYHEGDFVVKSVQTAIKQSLRENDRVMRQGGDAYLAMVQDADHRTVYAIQERLLNQIDYVNATANKSYRIHITWGYAISEDHETIEKVIFRANSMLNEKQSRSGRSI